MKGGATFGVAMFLKTRWFYISWGRDFYYRDGHSFHLVLFPYYSRRVEGQILPSAMNLEIRIGRGWRLSVSSDAGDGRYIRFAV